MCIYVCMYMYICIYVLKNTYTHIYIYLHTYIHQYIEMRGLRRILQRNSTFIDRRNTNKSLLEEASSIAYPSRCDRRKIIPFSEYHMNRRVKLLGHILRSNGNDPMRQISFLPDSAHRVEYGTKRVGKPRQNWLQHTKKYVYENILGHYDYGETHMNDQRVYEAAVSRQL